MQTPVPIGKPGFNLYLLFVISWFLHLTARIPILGTIRFDLLLVVILTILAFSGTARRWGTMTETDKWLRVLIIYALVTIPLVEWPGSVIRYGIETLIKAAVFYYFTVVFVDSESRLKKFIMVFVGCQLLRVMEPLYLHITEGYWGATASMANWEFMYRLSGAPSDIVNPNGLAYIVCTILPFLYFGAALSWFNRLIFLLFAPLCVYALMLTGSRTGFLSLIIVTVGILASTKRRLVWAVLFVMVAVIGFPMLSSEMQDRYFSTFGAGARNEATAQGRITGAITSFEVALRRPLFGHGLGTSREANANFGGTDQPAHNLYAEAAQELGYIGMIIFILLIKSIYSDFRQCKVAYASQEREGPGARIVSALQLWFLVTFVTSFASYGVTSYEWYLLGGLAVAMRRLLGPAVSASKEAGDRMPDAFAQGMVQAKDKGGSG